MGGPRQADPRAQRPQPRIRRPRARDARGPGTTAVWSRMDSDGEAEDGDGDRSGAEDDALAIAIAQSIAETDGVMDVQGVIHLDGTSGGAGGGC